MRVLNQFESAKWTQNFTETCEMGITIRQSLSKQLAQSLSAIYGVTVIENKVEEER